MKDNKLIAEFMWEHSIVLDVSDTKYHESWDWLIPVAQKLIDVYWSIDEQDEQDLQSSILNDKLDVVYQIVVELIEKYKDGKQ